MGKASGPLPFTVVGKASGPLPFTVVGKASGPLPAILVYHRFGASAVDSMTVRTSAFQAQLEWLRSNGFEVIPLARLVDGLARGGKLPAKAVVITVDDGHKTVLSEMLPLVRRERVPVTLFIYPSAISNASYALKWSELEALHQAGFDIQSHTYWHPNFKQQKRRLSADEYRELLRSQLGKSRAALAKHLGVEADMLAWPFGIYDDELLAAAAAAGYRAAFSLDRRHPRAGDRLLALPRYLITDAVSLREFARMLEAGSPAGTRP
ncbi:polysaccharide deacetylase family protein [Niveibacterium terrae]|uniref:polysaccharide deacetylase family protein n=1 Tax=Niveibacterium terrae TaxID=3373598 RepID=UPI003A90093E